MTTVLVACAGKNGGTREIAGAIGAELRAMDLGADVRDAADVAGIGAYDAVVLGSALYFHRWRPSAVRLLADLGRRVRTSISR
ncbi:flavodoxin domain-containing protein [Amycolatopsis sp. H20-H5]|uniref:flavodoxin domain-containing protein n=1 Tax=Amycolatopsis sp. H20-H5 TaxID=3046309 RepID=UPI002DB9C925|nr:flavodoxin domain-containing protein [Amycolatopsis sp. H20-H5]MEC3976061.1 flavodoxin domain-containing protein [Amycolatopsis sp. H20-H5]